MSAKILIRNKRKAFWRIENFKFRLCFKQLNIFGAEVANRRGREAWYHYLQFGLRLFLLIQRFDTWILSVAKRIQNVWYDLNFGNSGVIKKLVLKLLVFYSSLCPCLNLINQPWLQTSENGITGYFNISLLHPSIAKFF